MATLMATRLVRRSFNSDSESNSFGFSMLSPLFLRCDGCSTANSVDISLISHAVFDHDVHTLQQYYIPQRVTAHRDDVGVFAFANRAVILLGLHRDGGPVSGRSDRQHRINAQNVHPGVKFTPG